MRYCFDPNVEIVLWKTGDKHCTEKAKNLVTQSQLSIFHPRESLYSYIYFTHTKKIIGKSNPKLSLSQVCVYCLRKYFPSVGRITIFNSSIYTGIYLNPYYLKIVSGKNSKWVNMSFSQSASFLLGRCELGNTWGIHYIDFSLCDIKVRRKSTSHFFFFLFAHCTCATEPRYESICARNLDNSCVKNIILYIQNVLIFLWQFSTLIRTLDPTVHAFMSLASNSYISIKKIWGEV